MKEFRHGCEVDIGYEPGYRFSVRIVKGLHGFRFGQFQPYVRDLRKQEDIPGPLFEYCLAAEDFAETWRENYIKTKNINCIEKPKA